MTQTAALISRLREARDTAGLTRREMYRRAGLSPVESNWAQADRRGQGVNATLATIEALALACGVAPPWLAGWDRVPDMGPPRPRQALLREIAHGSGFGRLFNIWEESGGHIDARMWTALDRQGLVRSTYLFWEDGPDLRYALLGDRLIDVLGFEWWLAAPGQILGEHDPDPAMARWCLPDYRRALEQWRPLMHDCTVVSRYSDPLPCRYDRLLLPWLCGNRRALMVIVRLKPAFEGVLSDDG